MNYRKKKTRGKRFNAARYDRPGGRCGFVWPTRKATKTALRRVASDIYASRRENNSRSPRSRQGGHQVRRRRDARGHRRERMTAQRQRQPRLSNVGAGRKATRGTPVQTTMVCYQPARTARAAATPRDFVSRLPRRNAQARRKTPRA